MEILSGFEQLVQTDHREDLRKIRHVKQQMKSFKLHQKKKKLIYFEYVTRISEHSAALQDTPL